MATILLILSITVITYFWKATTDDGMMFVSQHYGIQRKWKSYLEENDDIEQAAKYYIFLLLVKTMSKKDHVWISFVEGLHWHASIAVHLMCSQFDLVSN